MIERAGAAAGRFVERLFSVLEAMLDSGRRLEEKLRCRWPKPIC